MIFILFFELYKNYEFKLIYKISNNFIEIHFLNMIESVMEIKIIFYLL
jgi:hypothetical protein